MIISGTLWACTLASSKAYTPPNLHRVGKNETFASISRRYHTGYERMMSANPDIVPEKLRPGMVVLIPGRIKQTPKAPASGKFSVQNGDTDWSVAKRYGIKPSQLRSMNPGVKWTALRPGTLINVPVKTVKSNPVTAPQSTMSNIASVKKASLGKHTVTEDENDWIIARGYGITPKQLRQLNPGVNWNRLRPGTKIVVPAKRDLIARITTKRAKVIKDNVLVRSGARTDSSRVTMVEYGRIASVADRIGNWYKLKFDGGTIGWVRGDLLKPVTAAMLAHAGASTSGRSIRRRTSEALVARKSTKEASPRRSVVREASASTKRSTRRATPSYTETVALSDNDRDGVIGTAMSRMGTRYRWGGTTPAGFDCSGFTGYVYARNGKRLPRTANEQSKQGQSVGKGELKKGDLVFFKTTRSNRVSHVGIYVGEGKFVHASSGGGRVRVNNLSDSYYQKRFAGAKRVSGGSGSSVGSSKSRSTKEVAAKTQEDSKPEVATKTVVSEDPKPATVKGTDVVGR